jgi:hypothetical protein
MTKGQGLVIQTYICLDMAFRQLIAAATIVCVLACMLFSPSVTGGLSEEFLPTGTEEKVPEVEVATFDPASLYSRALHIRSTNASAMTAWHWTAPFHQQGHVVEVMVPPPEA